MVLLAELQYTIGRAGISNLYARENFQFKFCFDESADGCDFIYNVSLFVFFWEGIRNIN